MEFLDHIAQIHRNIQPLQEGRPLGQQPEASSEGVVGLLFERAEDAQALYDFIVGVETGVELLAPGEVMLVIAEEWGQFSVNLSETVVKYKTDIAAAIIQVYRELFDFGIAEADEAVLAGYGLLEANPYHDTDGNFTSKEDLEAAKAGSFSQGKRKNKVSGKTKKKLKLVATKLPCGRDAREQGKDMKCSTGKAPAWVGSAVTRMVKKHRSKFKDGTKDEAVIWTRHDRMMLERIAQFYLQAAQD